VASTQPPIAFTRSNGLSFQCDWTNTTDQLVSFGEGALDEMCFVFGYYYPSTGVDTCLDGSCIYGTARLSDAGSSADSGKADSEGPADSGSPSDAESLDESGGDAGN
jgi:hypothetical protein